MSLAMNRTLASLLDFTIICVILFGISLFQPLVGLRPFPFLFLITIIYYLISMLILKGQTIGYRWRRLIILNQSGEVADFNIICRRFFSFLALMTVYMLTLIPASVFIVYGTELNKIAVTSMSMGIYYTGIVFVIIVSIPAVQNVLYPFIRKDKRSYVDKYSRTHLGPR